MGLKISRFMQNDAGRKEKTEENGCRKKLEEKEGENTEEREKRRKKKRVFSMKRMVILTVILFFGGIILLAYREKLEREKERRRMLEGERLRAAVSALFKESVTDREDVDGLDFGMEIYWNDISDTSHPLYGSCPVSWKAGGRITGMVFREKGELLEIIYEGPDKKEEIWRLEEKEGKLIVKVIEN